MKLKRILTLFFALGFAAVAGVAVYVIAITSNLPAMNTILEDYHPLLISEVYDRHGEKFGEFYRERRKLVPIEDIPQQLINAFVAAEDSEFYEHSGLNYRAIMRAAFANIKAGRKRQGASTITQQVARSILLSSEKTYRRKIKEAFLALRMEKKLTKNEILYLYLNQIFLGHGAYGVGMAAQIYFHKNVKDLQLKEMAILAGLPQAPSRYTPVYKPGAAKARQKYVLRRMADEGFITSEQAEKAISEPVTVYTRIDYQKLAPYYTETIRQMLVKELGEEMVLDKGIKIYTSLDLKKQVEAQKQVQMGLREVDKRQGYRGALKKLNDEKEIAAFLKSTRDTLIDDFLSARVIQPDGTIDDYGELNLTGLDKEGKPLPNIPEYLNYDDIVDAVVIDINDKWGLVQVRFAESKGLIDFETMKWARVPDPNVQSDWAEIQKPSEALHVGDVIQVRLVGKKFFSTRINKDILDLKQKLYKQKKDYERPEDLPVFDEFAEVELEQEPLAQGALMSFDQNTSDIISMVGGYDFAQSQLDRSWQAARQTGSAFKALVYAAALDKGFTPATKIIDAPLVFEEENKQLEEGADDDEKSHKWKPANYNRKFLGDILFRNALIRSLNVPTVKIIEKIGVDWTSEYARRLGIFSPLNMDYTLALGSSGVTLYEMTKVFAQFGRLGKKITPIIIHKVLDAKGNELLKDLSFDQRFHEEIENLNAEFQLKRKLYLEVQKRIEAGETWPDIKSEWASNAAANINTDKVVTAGPSLDSPESDLDDKANALASLRSTFDFEKEPPVYFKDKAQLIDPRVAYVITTMLQGVIEEKNGTGGRARALGRPAAGKTGTTSGYFDAWFIGFTPDIATGVWVGFDKEQTLGRGEGGGKTALPIWLEYMKSAHEGLPVKNFSAPDGIVFANIDNETGNIASPSSTEVVRQAFIEGTEPASDGKTEQQQEYEEEQNFYKRDLSE